MKLFHALCVLLASTLALGASAGMMAADAAGKKAPPPVPLGEDRHVDVLVIAGAVGADEYAKQFGEVIDGWKSACEKAGAHYAVIGKAETKDGKSDLARVEERLGELSAKSEGSLWIVLVGHGTFDGREAKFNLHGPDLTPQHLKTWLDGAAREIVLVNTASASAPFVKSLAGKDRIVVSATKSADEVYYTRFGKFFASAIGGTEEADIDHDRQVSVLEAFLYAARKSNEFYEANGRLATEHAILDDNGDGIGTRSEVFQGVVATETEGGGKPDGDRARQVCLILSEEEALLPETARNRRDELEREIRALAKKREQMGDDAYYKEIEKRMLELARIYAGQSS